MDKFHMLKFGLGIVLVFVGLKMSWLNEMFGGKFPVAWSLGIIGFLIGASVILSLIFPKRAKTAAQGGGYWPPEARERLGRLARDRGSSVVGSRHDQTT